jgi:hypothetical protein
LLHIYAAWPRRNAISARKAAEELNVRGVPAPAGGKWHARSRGPR